MESGLFCSLSDVTGAPLLWSHSRSQKMNHINKSHLCIALQLSWGQLVAFEAFWNLKKWRASNKVADVDALRRTLRDASRVLCIYWINMPLLILSVCEREPQLFGLLSAFKRVSDYKGSSYSSSCWVILFLNDASVNANMLRKKWRLVDFVGFAVLNGLKAAHQYLNYYERIFFLLVCLSRSTFPDLDIK